MIIDLIFYRIEMDYLDREYQLTNAVFCLVFFHRMDLMN